MILCPWCGTAYPVFQSNCKNCGGPLPLAPSPASAPAEAGLADEPVPLPLPPPPPRPIADSYILRLLWTDGLVIVALVFGMVGFIFFTVGGALTLGIVTALVGLPFALLGLLFLGGAGTLGWWRYQVAQRTVGVLRAGEALVGQIVGVEENVSVSVNGRHPWTIAYQFQVQGRGYAGRVTTLNAPGPRLRPGQPACVLYLAAAPEHNGLYPHP